MGLSELCAVAWPQSAQGSGVSWLPWHQQEVGVRGSPNRRGGSSNGGFHEALGTSETGVQKFFLQEIRAGAEREGKHGCCAARVYEHAWDTSWKQLRVGGEDLKEGRPEGPVSIQVLQEADFTSGLEVQESAWGQCPCRNKRGSQRRQGCLILVKEKWVGCISDFRPIHRKFQIGRWESLSQHLVGESQVLPCSVMLSHWQGAFHGKHSCGTYVTRSRGAAVSCQPVTLPYQLNSVATTVSY